jgi:hypothetical protein
MKLFGSRFHTILIAAAIASMPLGALAQMGQTMAFKAALAPSDSAKGSQGMGTMTGTLNMSTNVLSYHITYSGLSGPATAAHFHGPAAAGANAKPQVPIKPLESPISGQATLTPDQEKDLEAGMWYVNVHTAANPGGEIRGQVMAAQ